MIFKKKKVILHFLNYSPRIYSGLDRFNLVLSFELQKKGYTSVFIFIDKIIQKDIERDIIKSGSKVEILKINKNKIDTIKDLFHLIKKYRPAAVHAHFETAIKTILAFMCFCFRIDYFVTTHSLITDLSFNEFKLKYGLSGLLKFKFHLRLLLFFSKISFCVSNAIRNQYVEFCGVNSKKLQKIYLGVKINSEIPNKIQQRIKLNLPLDKFLIINVSAIEKIKGIDILIKSARILRNTHNLNNFLIIHVGGLRSEDNFDIEYAKTLKTLQKEMLDGSDNFIWLGKRSDIFDILSACDIYVHPSRLEGISVAIMEACAAHLPVVGSRVGGIPEIIHDDINGILFEPDNEIQLADALNKLITNEELRNRLASNAFTLIKENWDMEKQVKKLVEAYNL